MSEQHKWFRSPPTSAPNYKRSLKSIPPQAIPRRTSDSPRGAAVRAAESALSHLVDRSQGTPLRCDAPRQIFRVSPRLKPRVPIVIAVHRLDIFNLGDVAEGVQIPHRHKVAKRGLA